MQSSYEKILERISRTSGIEKEEIGRKVEAKRAQLSGLISREGAAQVVAAELGISFDNEKLKIDEILPGMRKVNFVGKVIDVSPVRTFERGGKEGKVVNLVVADETSNVKVVLWDTNHIELIENGEVMKESVVEIQNASVRDSEVHLGSFSELKKSEEPIERVKTERVVKEKKISDFLQGDSVSSRANIVQVYEPKFFNVCIECKKKVEQTPDGFECKNHGKVAAERKAVLNLIIDDGTETMRAVFFNDIISALGISELDDDKKFSLQKKNLLGKEMMFLGVVRKNNYFDNLEFIVQGVNEVNPDELIGELEKK